MIRHIALAVGLGALPVAAVAQQASDPAVAWEAANNQLGILEYCEGQGFTGPEAVATQVRLVEMLPQGDATVGANARQQGAQGAVSVGEAQVSLADAAEAQGVTVEATCQEIEAAVNEVEPSLPAG